MEETAKVLERRASTTDKGSCICSSSCKYITIFLPVISVFLTCYIYPFDHSIYKPIFQPPDWVFSVVWAYQTLVLGYVTYKAVAVSQGKDVCKIRALYIILVLLLNGWQYAFNYWVAYATSFWALVVALGVALSLLVRFSAAFAKNDPDHHYLVWFYLLLPLWLGLSTALNGVLYDHTYQSIMYEST